LGAHADAPKRHADDDGPCRAEEDERRSEKLRREEDEKRFQAEAVVQTTEDNGRGSVDRHRTRIQEGYRRLG